jgi:prepilin-type N-terminal cleavage/methylation domain-containing protein
MRAFTLVEVLVALLLFSLVAIGLADGLIRAQQWQSESGRWMRATALADEALERARAGAPDGADTIGPFRRRWSSSPDDGVRRLEAVVAWDVPAARELRMSTRVRP